MHFFEDVEPTEISPAYNSPDTCKCVFWRQNGPSNRVIQHLLENASLVSSDFWHEVTSL